MKRSYLISFQEFLCPGLTRYSGKETFTLKKLFGTVLCFGAFIIVSTAQMGPVAGGGDASGAGGTVSYSIGQVDYIMSTGGTGTINQGLQQPYEIFNYTGIDHPEVDMSLVAYPNPTIDYITLSTDMQDLSGYSYQLLNMEGQVIETKKMMAAQTNIDMGTLSSGAYLLTVMNQLTEIKTFKIIKK
jgi:hypothetical protein